MVRQAIVQTQARGKKKNAGEIRKQREETMLKLMGKNTATRWLNRVARHVATLDMAIAKPIKKERRLVPGSAENEEALIKKTWEDDAEPLTKYCSRFSKSEPPVLKALRDKTLAEDPRWEMIVDPLQMQMLTMLARSIGAKKTLDVGVFTGYSSLAMALALGPSARIVALEIDERPLHIAKEFWKIAGVQPELHVRPAIETLEKLVETPGEIGTFDFAFVDADKASYDAYYEKCLLLLRRGGLIAMDNMLWQGRVLDAQAEEIGMTINNNGSPLKVNVRFRN